MDSSKPRGACRATTELTGAGNELIGGAGQKASLAENCLANKVNGVGLMAYSDEELTKKRYEAGAVDDAVSAGEVGQTVARNELGVEWILRQSK